MADTIPAETADVTDPTEPNGSPRFARHWAIVTGAGLLGMIYYRCCLVGAPCTRFLVELGATPFHFGLISGLGAFTMACQLVSGLMANRLRRRKPVWMALFILHRLAFVGVLAAPGLFSTVSARLWWIIGVLCFHNVLTNLGDPLWFSWMTDLVPKDGFNSHWGRRQRIITIGSIAAQIVIAVWFGGYEARGEVIRGFVFLGLGGVVLGIIDIILFALVPEPEHQQDHQANLKSAFAEPWRNRAFRPFLVFQIYWNFAVMLAAPFFMVYLIREVGFAAFWVQILLVVHATGMALASGLWGRICDTHGYKPVLQFVTLFKFIVPLTYIVVPPLFPIAFPAFAVLFALDGMLNAGSNLALKGFALRCTPRRNRAMYVATASFLAMGLAGGLASLIAGTCIKPLTDVFSLHYGAYTFTGYHLIFVTSCLLRAGGILVARGLHEPASSTVGTMVTSMRCTGLFGQRTPQR